MSSQFLVQLDSEYMDTVHIPKLILRNYKKIGIKPNEWSLYCLISYLESEGEDVPSQPELADMMGLSERQLKNIIADLKKKNLLQINRSKTIAYDFEPLIRRAVEVDKAI